MNNLLNNPIVTNANYSLFYYNNINNNSNARMYIKNFFNPTHCHCSCHFHNIHHNTSYSNINYQVPMKLNLEQEYNYIPLRNRSMNNLLYTNIKNPIKDFKNNYYMNYNDYSEINNNNKKYDDEIKKDLYKEDKNIRKIETTYHSNKNLKINNDEIINNYKKNYNHNNLKNYNFNKYDIKPLKKSFKIKKKELAKYYHIINPKKYSYGGQKLQTVHNINNHQYKEVINTSNSKNKNLHKSRVINYNESNNNNDDNISNNNKLKIDTNNEILNNNINKNNVNYSYKSYQNSPTYISRNISNQQTDSKTELKPKIIKETYNTRLIDLKDLKKSPSENYLYNLNGEIKYKNNMNNRNYSSNNLIINSNNNLSQKENPTPNGTKNDKTSDYNYYKLNTDSNIKKYIPKSYSYNNLNDYKSTNPYKLKTNIENEYENDFSDNDTNINQNNIDYEMIKLKVKLALLKKEKYEQEKRRILNNNKNLIKEENLKNKKYLEKFLSKGNKKPLITRNNDLLEKTKKLLEEKKTKNTKKEQNDKNVQNSDNKILNSLKKNLKEKNDDNNKIIIKPKIKMNNQ